MQLGGQVCDAQCTSCRSVPGSIRGQGSRGHMDHGVYAREGPPRPQGALAICILFIYFAPVSVTFV